MTLTGKTNGKNQFQTVYAQQKKHDHSATDPGSRWAFFDTIPL